jgi:hypothetical protein
MEAYEEKFMSEQTQFCIKYEWVICRQLCGLKCVLELLRHWNYGFGTRSGPSGLHDCLSAISCAVLFTADVSAYVVRLGDL